MSLDADIVSSLHPPRLPEYFVTIGPGDFLAAFGFGLLLAALALMLVMPALRRRPRPIPLSQRIAAAADLPAPERMLALTRLLTEAGGTLPDDLRDALYRGDGGDPAQIEALIRAQSRHGRTGHHSTRWRKLRWPRFGRQVRA